MNSPAWQLAFESLRQSPDPARLSQIVALRPDVDELRIICESHGVLLLVDRALGQVRRELFSAEQFERWRRTVAAITLASLIKYRELQRLLPLFAKVEIPVVPFKGPVLSERLYGDPLLRMSNDLDLLVHPGKVKDAVALLEAESYKPEFDPSILDHLFDGYASVIHCEMLHTSSNWLVEIHWALFCSWRSTTISSVVLNDWIMSGEVDDAELLLYLCLHGTRHGWGQIKWVVDIDRFVRTANDLDWEQLIATAKERGCARALRLGLHLAHEVCDLELPSPVSAEIAGDSAVSTLSRRIANLWPIRQEAPHSIPWRLRYLLTCRERPADRFGMLTDYMVMRWKNR